MKKNDKLIVILGVAILIIASVGIYFWSSEEPEEDVAYIEDLFYIKSKYSMQPSAITVSDECPFYPLAVTPVVINYDSEGNQNIVPLYVEKPGDVSSALIKAENQIGYKPLNEISDLEAKDFSLYIAEKYWKTAEAALIIENNESGYNLGIVAAPIASYLGIPIIITDEIDNSVYELFEKLEVTNTIICGENLEGYKNTLRLKNVDDIIDAIIEIIWERLGHDAQYITVTNPRDAFQPEILDEKILLSEKGTLRSTALFPSNLLNAVKGFTNPVGYEIEIPEDYEYALIKIEVRNLEDPEQVEMFGDNLIFGGSLTGYTRTTATPAKRDANGNIEEDRFYFETVFYDSGGETHDITLSGVYHVLDSAEFEITITAEELENPYYSMMKQFSSIAPYLAACRQGIVYAEPNFAFVPTDEITLNGKTLPGNTQVMYNPILIPVVNQHVYENIHQPLNKLIGKIKDIEITDSVEPLKENCYSDPLYIALLGDSIMLPQYYYRSPHSDPYTTPKSGGYATNCPSDFIYGNIDPQEYSLLPYSEDYVENDIYSNFPEVENIVGRITGWDIQDASALIARTIFYEKIIDELGEWKDNAAVLTGAGCEVQRLPIFNTIQKLMGNTDPMKFPSGEKKFLVKRIINTFEQGEFNAQSAERGAAQREAFSTEALREIKTDGLLNRLFFPWLRVEFRQGFENSESLKDPEWWIKTLTGDSAELAIGGQLEENSNLIISDSHAIWFEKEHGDIMLHSLGGPFYELLSRYISIPGFRTSLECLGAFSVRDVPDMDMGPSVMLVEGCGSGKIDGMAPINSLANAYLHAGVNAYISPTTLSAFYGALEPRPNFNGGVGLGIAGYLKAWYDLKFKGQYIPVYFNQYIFEEAMLEMFEDDLDIGTALRDAKNKFLPAQFDITFRWTPPLSISSGLPEELSNDILNGLKDTSSSDARFPVEKYCTIYQINLLGDPAFNPYQPINEG